MIGLYVIVPSGVTKKCVGADPGANHCVENRRRSTPRRRGRSATWHRGWRSLPDEPDGPSL
jgi:hypothetical protein